MTLLTSVCRLKFQACRRCLGGPGLKTDRGKPMTARVVFKEHSSCCNKACCREATTTAESACTRGTGVPIATPAVYGSRGSYRSRACACILVSRASVRSLMRPQQSRALLQHSADAQSSARQRMSPSRLRRTGRGRNGRSCPYACGGGWSDDDESWH